MSALRRYQRAGRSGAPREPLREEFREARRLLRKTIRKAQEDAWLKLVEAVEADPWGLRYRIVTRKLDGKPADAEAAGREVEIAKGLFPSPAPPNWATMPMWNDPELDPVVAPVTCVELEIAATKLAPGKSPGPDGLYNEILKSVARWNPAVLLRAFNACMRHRSFPSPLWKRARIVFLYKGQGKPPDQPESFRPISLLDGAGKLLAGDPQQDLFPCLGFPVPESVQI